MKKEQLVREAVKLGLKHEAPIKAEDIFKICLDESYKENQIHKKEDCHISSLLGLAILFILHISNIHL
ncbi:hypothetical protein EXW31_00275 (plasmid) [Bacillus mycoides]|nr:hypothetical protein [Bacillus mycoides]QWG42922.1 hypothetical protein EXW31_00275 [Bacillus mycoides]